MKKLWAKVGEDVRLVVVDDDDVEQEEEDGGGEDFSERKRS